MKISRLVFIMAALSAAVLPLHAQLAVIRQGHETRGEQEAGDRFGAVVCSGDFNGDGFDDLAAGAPGEKIGFNFLFACGYVTVNRGSRHGLTWEGALGRGPAQAGLDEGEPHEMGAALASADFNADGYDDLAIGLPGSPVGGAAGAGRVAVFMGSKDGLAGSAALVLTQTPFGGANEAGDRFGAALAAGKLGTDQYADLVIGAPGENGTGSGGIGAGAVFVIRGGPDGLNENAAKFITAEMAQPGAGAFNGGYGFSLAIGHLRGGPEAELAVGMPFLPHTGGVQGMVIIHAGTATSVADLASDALAASDDTVAHVANTGFGYALAIGRFNPGSDPTDPNAPRALAIGTLNNGSVSLARLQGTQIKLQNPIIGASETIRLAGGGRALAAGDLDGDGDDDLAIGRPLHDVESAPMEGLRHTGQDSGGLYLREFRDGAWVLPEGSLVDEATTGALYGNGAMGACVAIGRFSSGARRSVAAGCPGASNSFFSDGAGYVVDHAPWRQINRPGCRSALSVNVTDEVVYALRPFEPQKLASTTKIMTVLLGCEATERPASDPRRVGLNQTITIEDWIEDQFYDGGGGTHWGFREGERHSFHNLLRTCIMVSGNDSAFAIADAITNEASDWNDYDETVPQFSAMMNARAAQLGMTRTHFVAPSGRYSTSTAWDMWLLARYAMQNDLFMSIVSDTFQDISYQKANGQNATRGCHYGWLKGLQQQDSRIAGGKPGGSPEAGRTCVAVGVEVDDPKYIGEYAYGIGLGWFGDYKEQSQRVRVELVQLGLGIGPAPKPKFAAALDDAAWLLADPARPRVAQGNFFTKGAAERTEPAAIHVLRPADVVEAPPLDLVLEQDIPLLLPPGKSSVFAMAGLGGHRGLILRNNGEAPAALIIEAAGGTARVTLAPGEAHRVPPAAGDFSIRITAAETTAELALSAVCDLAPHWPRTVNAPAFTVRIHLPDYADDHAWRLTARPLSPLAAPFPLRIILDEPANGLAFPRLPEITGLRVAREPRGDLIDLSFRGLPGLEPSLGYDLLASPALEGAWEAITRIPPAADGSAAGLWRGHLPTTDHRFFILRPVPEP